MCTKGALRAFTEFSTLTVHNFKTIVAMGMNIGKYIISRNSEPRTLLVWAWRAAASIDVENCRFMPHFKALLLEPGTVPSLLTFTTRPELLTNQELKPRPSQAS